MTSTDTPGTRCETIAALVATHPKLFRGQFPPITSIIPKGWYRLVHQVCNVLENTFSDYELADIEIKEISNQSSTLMLELRVPFHLTEEQIALIDGHIYAVRCRSAVCCVECGEIAETVAQRGERWLCEEHRH